jgi:hypothetical protein
MDCWKHGVTLALGLLALLGENAQALAAQKQYAVGRFSHEFRATVTLEDTGEVFQPGSVSVFERRSGRRLLRVGSAELAFDVENGQVPPNVKEVPYGRQSVLIYEDFDFDGHRDLAIMDGQKSCYHGPSFQIFLRQGSGFAKSETFTQLAQDYCGMFTVDASARRLFNMTKSGCCWHQFDTYEVVNHGPRLLESVVESLEEESPAYLRKETSGRRSSTEHLLLTPDESGSKLLLAFELAGSRKKRVEVFATEGALDYALVVGPERHVELSYRLHVVGKANDAPNAHPFSWDPTSGELSFQNGAYRYVIHDGAQGLGVTVHFRNRVVFLPGVEKSRSGTLRGLVIQDFENVMLSLPF